jgi:outer membrane protein
MDNNTNEKEEIQGVEINLGIIQEDKKVERNTSEPANEEPLETNPPKEQNKGNGKCIFKIILWIVVILAIVGLYVLYFTQSKAPVPKAMPVKSGESTAMILTVNTDSIMEHFSLVKILEEDIRKETEKYHNDLETKSKAFATKYQNLMDNIQNNRITQTQAENAQRQLLQEQGQLEALDEQYTNIIQNKSLSVQTEIMDSIRNAASRVNLQLYQSDFVFAVSSVSAIIYSSETYDITDQVIKELNDSYKKSTK